MSAEPFVIQELDQLHRLVLMSVVGLGLLCVLLIGLVWVTLNLSQLLERVRATLGRVTAGAISDQRSAVSQSESVADTSTVPKYRPLQTVVTTEEFVSDGGLGSTIPAGTQCLLLKPAMTSGGRRWSAVAIGTRIPYLVEDLFRPLRADERILVNELHRVLPLCERDWIAQQYCEASSTG